MVRAATYRRVSTSVQAEEGESLDTQLQRLHAYALANGWEVVEDYCDEGISGAKRDRPALTKLLEDAKTGRFQKILVLRLDRLTRSVKHFHDLAEEMDRSGVAIVSVTQNIDTSTSTGRLLRNILVDFANFERELIMERVLENKESMAQQGKWYGSKPPWGMARGEDGMVRAEPDKRDLIANLFTHYEQEPGASIASTCRHFRLPFGLVHRILCNPVYAGHFGFRRRIRRSDGVHTVIPRNQWQIIPSPEIEPIVSIEQWWRIQYKLERQRHNIIPAGLSSQKASAFAGLVYCSICGQRLRRNGSKLGPYYNCFDRTYYSVNRHVSVNVTRLTEAVLAEANRVVDMDEAWQHALSLNEAREGSRHSKVAHLESEIAKLDEKINRLTDQLADGAVAEIIKPRLLSLDRQRQDLRTQHSELLRRSSQERDDIQSFRQLLSSLSAAFAVATPPEQRELLQILIDRIEVGRDFTTIQWACDWLKPSVIPTPQPLNSLGNPFYLDPLEQVRRMPDAELLSRYKEEGRNSLARSLGVRPMTLYKHLVERGLLQTRKRSEIKPKLSAYSNEDLLAALANQTVPELAERIGIHKSAVYKELRDRGLGLGEPRKKKTEAGD